MNTQKFFAYFAVSCLGMLTAVSASVNRPMVLRQPADLYVAAGETAVFSADISGAPFSTLVWHMTSPTEGPHIIQDDLGFNVHQMTLAVPNCIDNWSYNGWYWLSATNAGGGTITRKARLIVISAPRITWMTPDRTVRSGASVTLSVTLAVDGAPWTRVQWLKDGRLLSSARSLLLRNVSPGNSGMYSCQVTTIGGTTMYGTVLTVR